MATPKGYTTRQEIQNYLLITIDASFYAQVDNWIAEIEKYIDQKTGRNFIADTVASEKLYDGYNEPTLLIDDCVDVTEVKIGDDDPLTEGSDEDYVVYPANFLPKTRLKLILSTFPSGDQNIHVTGKWGYSVTVPDDIKMIATVLVAGIINFSLNAEGEVQQMSIGRYSVTYKTKDEWQDFKKVDEILKYYKKYVF
jgi:hypothetical protein